MHSTAKQALGTVELQLQVNGGLFLGSKQKSETQFTNFLIGTVFTKDCDTSMTRFDYTQWNFVHKLQKVTKQNPVGAQQNNLESEICTTNSSKGTPKIQTVCSNEKEKVVKISHTKKAEEKENK